MCDNIELYKTSEMSDSIEFFTQPILHLINLLSRCFQFHSAQNLIKHT